MLELVIDVRKARDAGIGTYLRRLVPRVLQRMPRVPCTLWLAAGEEAWLTELQATCPAVTGRVLPARPLSAGEQLLLRRAVQPGQLLWATSLSHPLFHRGPLVATVHDVAQLALPPALAGGRLMRFAARIYLESLRRCTSDLLFISEFTRQEFQRLVGTPRQRAAVTLLGVDASWFSAPSLGTPQRQPYFIAVSSVRPHKNFAFLVRAFTEIAHLLPHRLLIVGESQGLRTVDSSLAAQIAASGDRVQFLGRLEDTELRRCVANADAMVFPSLYEGFGLPPLEAMAARCPVLCSTAGALREVCDDAAVYFDPRDGASLRQALLSHTATQPAVRAERVARGIARARMFDWERTADATAAVLQRALHGETN